MSVKLIDKFATKFIANDEVKNSEYAAKAAFELVKSRSGAGADFLGWVDLPENYDKE